MTAGDKMATGRGAAAGHGGTVAGHGTAAGEETTVGDRMAGDRTASGQWTAAGQGTTAGGTGVPARVLITNDDGIDSPGIRALARAVAAAELDVVIAAPLREASGMSASVTATERDGKVVLECRELPGLDGIPAYGVAGSPGFISLIATRGAFGRAPDLVLSGINRGANAGHAVLHSGTVGAAMTAAAGGARAMAVSLDVLTAAAATAASGGAALAEIDRIDDESRHWDTAASLAVSLLPVLGATPAGTVLNLNVPDTPVQLLRGLRRAAMARFGQVQITIAEVGHGYLRTALEEQATRLEEGTDLAYLASGYACVTALQGIAEADRPRLPDVFDLPIPAGHPAPPAAPPPITTAITPGAVAAPTAAPSLSPPTITPA